MYVAVHFVRTSLDMLIQNNKIMFTVDCFTDELFFRMNNICIRLNKDEPFY